MIKRLSGIVLCLCLIFSLTGCDFFTADTAELLSPPELTGDLYPISEAIKMSVSGNYTLEYPSRGDYRSAIVQHDINRDGILEAFAFYSTQGENGTVMNINAVANRNDTWSSVATADIAAGGVDRIDFCDLDHDGTDEILVGWEIYGTSELKLAVYSLGEKNLTQRMLEQYTHYTTCDLDNNDRNEIFIVRSFPSEARNSAHLYSLSNVGVNLISSCELDSAAKTLNHPTVSTLSGGAPAIFIDEIKGIGAVTEVIFLEKGVLQNPLLNKETKETTATLRSASLECRDINADGILEIPVSRDVPTVTRTTESEKQYLTEWCSFNGQNLTVQLTAFMNLNEGYYYILPQKWLGNIAISRDSENALTEIYRFSSEENVSGERLMFIKSVKKSDWDNGVYKIQDAAEIVNDGETSYICNISDSAAADGITAEKVKSDFKLLN